MVRNEEKYEQAVQFRTRGFTLEEIAKICDVSKSTVSKWLKNNNQSALVTKQNKRRAGIENAKRLRLVNKARTGERKRKYTEAERSARTEFNHYKKDPHFMAGMMVYICDGDRTHAHRIRISSSKVDAHGVFIRFIKAYAGVQNADIKVWLQLYPAHKESICMKHWKTVTGLPFSQFGKSQVVRANAQVKPLHFGVGNTIIGNTVLKRKLDTWSTLVLKELKTK